MFCCHEEDWPWVLRKTPAITTCYTIRGRLGSDGATGQTFEATRLDDGEKFAVKQINKTKYKELGFDYAGLRNKVAMMTRANGHRNTIQFKEVFEDKEHVYIVM